MKQTQLLALVMAGGSGTRFWPRSRKSLPKQYLSLFGKSTLIQATVERIRPLVAPENIYICTTEAQKLLVEKQLPAITGHILEPESKNTAPCLIYSVVALLRAGVPPTAVMAVLPADHYVESADTFRNLLASGAGLAAQVDGLITLGIVPTHAHVGYGYIEAGEKLSGDQPIFKARQFIEKPARALAEKLVQDKKYYWNGGIFIWKLETLIDAFKKFMPREWERLNGFQTEADLRKIYAEMPAISIDKAVLEKADNVYLMPADMGWNDLGSWSALYALSEKTAERHVDVSKNVVTVQSRGCLVDAPGFKTVALVGVEDLIVIEDNHTLLITQRACDQLVRDAARLAKDE